MPRQQIRRMADDEVERSIAGENVGPNFPSGMSAPEVALLVDEAPEEPLRELLAADDDEIEDAVVEDEPPATPRKGKRS